MAEPTSESPAVSPKTTAAFFYWGLAFLLALAFAMEVVSIFMPVSFIATVDAAFIVVAAASTLAALWRQLPLQNVFLATLGIVLIGGGVSAFAGSPLGARTELPFGPFLFAGGIGPLLFNVLPWVMPFIWVVVVLNSRGTARLILRPWRKNKTYGYKVIGLTALLVLLFDVAFDPFASRIKHFWLWMPTRLPLTWEGASLINFLAWALVTVLILLFTAPALIVKRPRTKRGPDWHPLCLWLGALVLFGINCGVRGIWAPVIADAVMGVAVAIFAIRGALW